MLTSRRIIYVFLAALILALGGRAEGASIENITFRTNAVPYTSNAAPIPIRARLYLPDKPEFPLSAVVITPSSAGVREELELYYANELANAGIAALVVDSFGSRGLGHSMHDQSVLHPWQAENDTIGALRWLTGNRRFKRDRIAIMGASRGGIAALHTALQVRRKWMQVGDIAFAAHVAIVPGCMWPHRSLRTTGAPIFFMLAELDDITPAADCVKLAERLRKAGNRNVTVKIYEGAHHAWESLGKAPHFDPKTQNFSRCHGWVEDNGRSVSAKGEMLPYGREFEWLKRHCMTLGSHCCGGTPELKRQATDDLIAFLRKYRF